MHIFEQELCKFNQFLPGEQGNARLRRNVTNYEGNARRRMLKGNVTE